MCLGSHPVEFDEASEYLAAVGAELTDLAAALERLEREGEDAG